MPQKRKVEEVEAMAHDHGSPPRKNRKTKVVKEGEFVATIILILTTINARAPRNGCG
jgi:hypothetical protein